MALVTPDFSESTDGPIMPGDYAARILKAEVKTSQAGNTYVKWELGLFNCDGDYAKYNDRKVWHNTMLTGRGAGMFKKFVKAATGEAPAEGRGFDTDTMIGREIRVTLAERLDQDGTVSDYPDVKAVHPMN